MTNYLKKNKWKIIISTLVTLVPMLAGLILWSALPDKMPIHWGPSGEVDGWASKGFAVFGIPTIMAALNLVCSLATGLDHKNKNQSKRIVGLVFWIVPIMSLLLGAITYLVTFDVSIDAVNIVVAALGILFAFIGNYLPKSKLNYTIGIKVIWTLESEVNWLATHRFAGKVWMVGGIVLALSAFLPTSVLPWTTIAVLLIMAAAPLVYSYLHFRRHEKDEGYFRVGEIEKKDGEEGE